MSSATGVTVQIPGPCPHCGGRKFARIANLRLAEDNFPEGVPMVLLGSSFEKFSLIMCRGCGKSDWFSQNPKTLLTVMKEHTKYVEIAESDAPYR